MISRLRSVPDARVLPVGSESYIDQRRREGIRAALSYLRDGCRGRAHYELARSVMDQARVAGLRNEPDAPAEPAAVAAQDAQTGGAS